MKFALAIYLLILAILAPSDLGAQVTSNVFERVLNIRVNANTPLEATATAFTIDVDGREYLITAKHVVKGLHDQDKIDVFMNGTWSSLEFEIYRCDDPVDIAVLIPPHQMTVNFPLPFEKTDFRFGQEAFFLGFPYGIQATASGANGPYPLAMIKRGAFSGNVVLDRDKKATMILLDGYNNPGFSGGPIVYRDFDQSGYVLNLAGVVSGFIPEVVPTMKEHNIASPSAAGPAAMNQPWRIKKRSNGTYFEYVDSGTFVALNTGIIEGYFIDPAIDLIRQHPIGPRVTDLPGNDPAER